MNFYFQDKFCNLDNEITPLVYCAATGKIELLKLLVENDMIDLNMSTRDMGFTPVAAAACTGNYESLFFLLENGGDVKILTEHGFSPLALTFSRLEDEDSLTFENIKICFKMVQLLLKYGCQIDEKLKLYNGKTFLMQYCGIKFELSTKQKVLNLDVIRFLLQNGANPHLKTKKGKSAFDFAKKHPLSHEVEAILNSTPQTFFYPSVSAVRKQKEKKLQLDFEIKEKEEEKSKSGSSLFKCLPFFFRK